MENNKTKLVVEKLIAVIQEAVNKEKALSELFNTRTNFFDEYNYHIQEAVYEALDFEEEDDDVGDFKEGLFNLVINEILTIWDLVDLLKEKKNLWNKYVKKEIDLETYYDEKLTLEFKYKIH